MLDINNHILQTTGAERITGSEAVQTLWSGYGAIKRYNLAGGKYPSVIVKHIQLPDGMQNQTAHPNAHPTQHTQKHPKGGNTDLSHQRKLTSYQVERQWYQKYAHQTNTGCRLPACYHTVEAEGELLLIMEDLDVSGFPVRLVPEAVSIAHAKSCLSWLAHFHAQFMGVVPEGLWPIGTYWHLATRPNEWEKMTNIHLKNAAKGIDETLNKAYYQTLVHGDAKLANFCFGGVNKAAEVAAVDFQYVGRGCGMKDVAYFISSCFDEADCEKYEAELLAHYFNVLDISINETFNFQALKDEWTILYRYAWADFYRFLDGWSPGHWKMHQYSKQITKRVLDELDDLKRR
jgi:hypothetical protein